MRFFIQLFFAYTALYSTTAMAQKREAGKLISDPRYPEDRDYRHLLPRIGIGYQKLYFAEVGIQRTVCSYNSLLQANTNTYVAADIFFTNKIIGPKLGAELHVGPIGLGADFTWYTDFKKNVPTLSPKISISAWQKRIAHITYGYHFFLTKNRLTGLGQHQLCLVSDFRLRFVKVRNKNATKNNQ
jgi:hypothetical protein